MDAAMISTVWGVKTKFALREIPICRWKGSFETLHEARRVRKLGRADLQGKSSAPPAAARVKVDAPIVGTHSPVRPEAEPTADGQAAEHRRFGNPQRRRSLRR